MLGRREDFSALQRAEIAERTRRLSASRMLKISVLFNEPKLLKLRCATALRLADAISVLFNEPKLLKARRRQRRLVDFSALQRAEIAETAGAGRDDRAGEISVLFNEPKLLKPRRRLPRRRLPRISVLFNEPKLLKGEQHGEAQRPYPFQCSSTSRNC